MASGIFPNLFLLMVSVFVYRFLVFERSVNENFELHKFYINSWMIEFCVCEYFVKF